MCPSKCPSKSIILLAICAFILAIGGCSERNWNNPHNSNKKESTYYASFSEQPKTLDPAKSYSANETIFTAQIYEPPLQYHYLKRPYELVPLIAAEFPKVTYYDAEGKPLPENAKDKLIAYSVYDIKIKPGIYYHPHPALAKNSNGDFLYHNLTETELTSVEDLKDFSKNGTRELTAEDYVYQIKRLAHPNLQSPIFGLMSQYILGLKELNQDLMTRLESGKTVDIDELANINFAGAKAISRYHYQIKLKGKYQQFIYWLAMPFFAPIPWEADAFYKQKGLQEKNVTLDWFPIGTGPYWLSDNDPNRQMVLTKNKFYRTEYYPGTSEAMPFIEQYHFSLEKESIPRWSKFLQGYYDQSSISSDNFDQAIQITDEGKFYLSSELKNKQLKLQTSVSPAIYYFGFNMLDPIVGGYSERAKKLRQAISIAIDFEEYINIFLNGRGMPAYGPVPPGVFGYSNNDQNMNSYVYEKQNGQLKRKNIEQAKKLLTEAGYPHGRDEKKTGRPLVLYFDTAGAGTESQATFAWLSKQFDKLGIQLQIRSTQYNRFQQKMQNGSAQMYMWGWLADYPDPENFLFLFYGSNGKVLYGGENASNYQNKEFDKLFEQMRNLPNGNVRQEIIKKMIRMVQEDAPWAGGYYPKQLQLSHHWLSNTIPNAVANNVLKYQKLNPIEREKYQIKWNKPVLWPIFGLLFVILLALIPVGLNYWRKQNKVKQKK